MCRNGQGWLAGFCGMLIAFTNASAQEVLEATFGGTRAAAFVVEGGREAVSVGIAGVDLSQARLKGATSKPAAIDPVSRLVVFEVDGLKGLTLGPPAQIGHHLICKAGKLQVESRVKQVGGRYLPFTLLKLRYMAGVPVPGTPLLDSKGRVVALAHERAGAGRIYAVPVEVIRRALAGARTGAMARAWLGLILNPQVSVPKVVRIVEGSPAEEAGLAPGDTLIEIDGQRIVDYGDAVNAFYLLRIGAEVRVKYRRGGEDGFVRLIPRLAGSR